MSTEPGELQYDRDKLADAGLGASVPNRAQAGSDQSRDRLDGANPYGGMLFTERNFDIVDAVRGVAGELDVPMVQVALAWVLGRPGMSTLLLGASKPEQVTGNLAALDLDLSDDQRRRLDEVSTLPMLNPYFIFGLPRETLFGGVSVSPWTRG